MRANANFNNKILTALILTVLLFAIGASAGTSPTSLLLTAAPCDSNFNCAPGSTASVGQFVRITAHVVYSGTVNPTGPLCIVDNGLPVNCSLTPVADENWFVNDFTAGVHKLSATYAGDSINGGSTSGTATFTVGSAASPVTPVTPVVVPVTPAAPVTPVVPVPPVAPANPPTSLLLTAAPCDSNFNCAPGSTASVGQFVRITAHVVYGGTVNPTGSLCIVDNGLPVNCGLTPVADENWFVNSFTAGVHKLSATYAGDSINGGSTSGTASFTVGSAASPVTPVAPTSVNSATPQLTVNPSSLSFGNTTMGTSNSLSVALTNSGNSSVSISNTTISGPGFTASGATGSILNPGQSASLNVTFTPAATGTVSGNVAITSNATTAKINLSGVGVQPTITSITVTPANQTVSVGNQLQFQAMDNNGNDVTSSVVWSSSDSSIVSISANGLAMGLANGTATIAATQ